MPNHWFSGRKLRRRPTRVVRAAARFIGPESLEIRTTPAVIATFSPAAGVLTVIGDKGFERS